MKKLEVLDQIIREHQNESDVYDELIKIAKIVKQHIEVPQDDKSKFLKVFENLSTGIGSTHLKKTEDSNEFELWFVDGVEREFLLKMTFELTDNNQSIMYLSSYHFF